MKLSFLRSHVEVCRESKQLYEERKRYNATYLLDLTPNHTCRYNIVGSFHWVQIFPNEPVSAKIEIATLKLTTSISDTN